MKLSRHEVMGQLDCGSEAVGVVDKTPHAEVGTRTNQVREAANNASKYNEDGVFQGSHDEYLAHLYGVAHAA